MIRNAYRLGLEAQITGFPAWADHDCFDIEARADEDRVIELGTARERNLQRLQSLLISRFQLRTHWESDTQRGYALFVGKKGANLRRSKPGRVYRTQQSGGRLLCVGCSIAKLTLFLANFVEKPVQDETGVQGLYDFSLTFEPLNSASSSDSPMPSLFSVLKERLGLKLEPKNIVVRTLVVDHIERPSGN